MQKGYANKESIAKFFPGRETNPPATNPDDLRISTRKGVLHPFQKDAAYIL